MEEIRMAKNSVLILIRVHQDGSGTAYWMDQPGYPHRYMEARVDDAYAYRRRLLIKGWKQVRE